MDKIRVLIADDHAILRSGLRLLINAQPDLESICEVANAQAAIDKTLELQPDVLLLDFSMPGGNTCAAIETIRQRCPKTRILVLSMYDDAAYMIAVMAAGSSGYVLKRSADTELLNAIRAVVAGKTFVDPSIASNIIQHSVLKRAALHSSKPGTAGHLLSQREREVLELLALGHTNQEVADRLFLSVKTVETHRARLMRKLGLHTRADLIRFARETGMIAQDRTV